MAIAASGWLNASSVNAATTQGAGGRRVKLSRKNHSCHIEAWQVSGVHAHYPMQHDAVSKLSGGCMKPGHDISAVAAGGASGLGEAIEHRLTDVSVKVVVFDTDIERKGESMRLDGALRLPTR